MPWQAIIAPMWQERQPCDYPLAGYNGRLIAECNACPQVPRFLAAHNINARQALTKLALYVPRDPKGPQGTLRDTKGP
jgi:hypothetical protein